MKISGSEEERFSIRLITKVVSLEWKGNLQKQESDGDGDGDLGFGMWDAEGNPDLLTITLSRSRCRRRFGTV